MHSLGLRDQLISWKSLEDCRTKLVLNARKLSSAELNSDVCLKRSAERALIIN